MAESKLAGPIKLCRQQLAIMCFSVVLVFSMLGLGRILISDLVVANLLMYSLSRYDSTFTWPRLFYTKGVLDEIYYSRCYLCISTGFSQLKLVLRCILRRIIIRPTIFFHINPYY